MNHYRISKYDPKKRVNGFYPHDEWTDYSDIGDKQYNLDRKTYKSVESAYLDTIMDAFQGIHICTVELIQMEYHAKVYKAIVRAIYPLKRMAPLFFIRMIAVMILRNKIWALITINARYYIHFGWDYYVYLGCSMSKENMEEKASFHHLFCEEMISPYLPM